MSRRDLLRLFLFLAVFPWLWPSASSAATTGWEETLERVSKGVVALRVSATRPFDTENASVSVATGFVVDAERGILLTNRHVVHPGPVTADAVFLNHEKIPVEPIYRDPVHDFGFFRFDPSQLRFIVPEALRLAPESARVGSEIRVIGNDAGEKLSILDGTLARLDREAPSYGRGRYNDFNTFYYQAASSSSGGSSGSPVVNRDGEVVALNAGGRRSAASSFFLPLERVVRALREIQQGAPVARGTLQAVFAHQPFDELARLGLQPASEASARSAAPDANGLLVVSEIVPGGPAHGVLEPGDILLRVAGRRILGFAALEDIFDASVGKTLDLAVERGGDPLELRVQVGDLHAITPSRYLEFGGAVVHPLSYQLARSFGVPVGGIHLASQGYVFRRGRIPARVVITSLAGEPVADLTDFEQRLARQPQGARVALRYFPLANPRSPGVGVIQVDRRWFPMQSCVRDDAAGYWDCMRAPDAPPAQPQAPATTALAANGSKAVRAVAHSLALVGFDVPLSVDGVQGSSFSGCGIVVDAASGLVVVDRDTVPVSLGDVELTFAGSVRVPGQVVALHPEHNLAAVSYDPALLGETPVRSAALRGDELEPGEALSLVVMTARHQLLSRSSEVARIEGASLPLPTTPRFRETNVDLVFLTETLPGVGGVLADKKGRVRALWASFSADDRGKPRSFFAGIPASLVEDFVAPLRAGLAPSWRSLGAELQAIPLAEARARGLSSEQAKRLEAHDPVRRQVLAIRRIQVGTPAAEALEVGDLILAADGRAVSAFREVERAAAKARVALLVSRDGRVEEHVVQTVAASGAGTDRVLVWSGALLQRPPAALAVQRGIPRQGVYVAGRWSGSPADRHRLGATRRITAVGGTPTGNLDEFLDVVASKQDRDSVRLRTEDLEGKVRVITLELDLRYWPTFELRREKEGWVRRALGEAPLRADGRPCSGCIPAAESREGSGAPRRALP